MDGSGTWGQDTYGCSIWMVLVPGVKIRMAVAYGSVPRPGVKIYVWL